MTVEVMHVGANFEALGGRQLQVRHTDARGQLDAFEAEAVRLVGINRVVGLMGGTTPDEVARLDAAHVPVLAPAEWLRDDPADLPALKKVEVLPGNRTQTAPARRQQLAVLAHFADGSVRDVTRLTAFSTSDENVATVDANGLVEGNDVRVDGAPAGTVEDLKLTGQGTALVSGMSRESSGPSARRRARMSRRKPSLAASHSTIVGWNSRPTHSATTDGTSAAGRM